MKGDRLNLGCIAVVFAFCSSTGCALEQHDLEKPAVRDDAQQYVGIDRAVSSARAAQNLRALVPTSRRPAERTWSNQAFEAEDVLLTARFTVSASRTDLDAVIGVSQGAADGFVDQAAAVRLNSAGYFDARDGADYAADQTLRYVTGVSYGVELIVNLGTHTYSVVIRRSDTGEHVLLADEYAFRSEQRDVESLDHLSWVVDSRRGQLSVGDVSVDGARGVAFARAGNYELEPLPSGDVLASPGDGSVLTLSSDGSVLGSAAASGDLAVDAAGNIYAAQTISGDIVIAKYDSTWRPLANHRYGTEQDELAGGISVDHDGNVLLAFSAENTGGTRDFFLQKTAADGSVLWTLPRPTAAVAADPTGGFVVASSGTNGTITLQKFNASAEAAWSQSFVVPGADLGHVTCDTDGNVLFAGTFRGSVNFGGQDLTWRSSELPNGSYVVKLAGNGGGHVYSAQLGMTELSGIDTNARGELVVAGVDIVYPIFFHFVKFDATGQQIGSDQSFDLGLGTTIGRSYSIALGDSGMVYWNVEREAGSLRTPYLVALAP